jgi:hypothetical protein
VREKLVQVEDPISNVEKEMSIVLAGEKDGRANKIHQSEWSTRSG